MIQHRHTGSELRGVVVGQQKTPRPDAQPLGLQQRLRDQQIGRRMRLPRRRVMLANPGLGIPKLIQPAQSLKVPVVAGLQSPLGRMGRHGEIAEFHGGSSLDGSRKATPFRASVAIVRQTPPELPWPSWPINLRSSLMQSNGISAISYPKSSIAKLVPNLSSRSKTAGVVRSR